MTKTTLSAPSLERLIRTHWTRPPTTKTRIPNLIQLSRVKKMWSFSIFRQFLTYDSFPYRSAKITSELACVNDIFFCLYFYHHRLWLDILIFSSDLIWSIWLFDSICSSHQFSLSTTLVLPQNVQLHSLRSKSSFHTSSVSVLTFTLIFDISVLRLEIGRTHPTFLCRAFPNVLLCFNFLQA